MLRAIGLLFLLFQTWTVNVKVTKGPDGTYQIVLTPQSTVLPIVTDPSTVVKEPPPPALPGRWKTFTDPTFGTTILQLTDAQADGSCGVQYGMWSVLNADDAMALIMCGNNAYVYRLDPATMAVKERISLPPSLQAGDAIWSHTDPYVLYHRCRNICAYNVATGQNSIYINFGNQFSDAPEMFRMTASENDDVFCFTRETTDWKWVGYGCAQKSTGKFWKEPVNRFGEPWKVWIDKLGRYLWNNAYSSRPEASNGVINEVIDLQSNYRDTMTFNAPPDWGPGHGVQGPGWVIGADAANGNDKRRNWTSVHTFTDVYPPSNDWSVTAEHTMLNKANDYYYVAYTEMLEHKDGLMHDELVGRATDCSGKVRRLAHMHQIVNYVNGAYDYYTIAKPSSSYSGKFVAFSSNWGVKDGPSYAFLVRVP